MVISFSIEPIAYIISTPAIMLYISEANILRVILLLFVELQWIRFPLIINSSSLAILFARIITYPIWELKSLLFANELSTKTKSLAVANSSGM
jgi:hypothetical protein